MSHSLRFLSTTIHPHANLSHNNCLQRFVIRDRVFFFDIEPPTTLARDYSVGLHCNRMVGDYKIAPKTDNWRWRSHVSINYPCGRRREIIITAAAAAGCILYPWIIVGRERTTTTRRHGASDSTNLRAATGATTNGLPPRTKYVSELMTEERARASEGQPTRSAA